MYATFVTEDDAERDARMGSSTSAGRRVVFMQRATDGEAELACVGADQLWTRCAAVFDVEWRSLCHCEVGRSARGGPFRQRQLAGSGEFWGTTTLEVVGCRPSLRHPPGLLRPSHSPGTHSIMLGGAGSPGALGAGPLRWLVGLCGGVSALALGVVRGLSATWERAFLAADSEMMRPLPLRAVSLACFPFGAKMRDPFVGTIRCGTESSLAIDRHPDEYCDCRCD